MTPHHVRLGSGPASILAIHCTLAHAGAWKPFAKALEGEAEILAYDLPSHGRSPNWDGQGDLHRLATDWALSLLDTPRHVVGHSFGATVALRLGIEAPARVKSLTIIEPPFYALALADQFDLAALPDNSAFEAAMQAGDMPLAARLFNRLWGDGTPWAEIPEKTRAYMARCMPFVGGSTGFMVHDKAGLIPSGALEALRMPARLIQGEEALPVIDAVMAGLARRMPHAERVTLANAGHMAPITHPSAVAEAVRPLLMRP